MKRMLAQKNGLSGTALKTIALVLMLLDHIHYFFAFTGAVPTLFSMLGRHHGRRMELFAGGRAAVPAAQPPDPSGRRLGAEQLNVSCSACWRRWGG